MNIAGMNIGKIQHVWQLSFEGDWPTSVAFVGGSRRLVAGNRGGQIYQWDLPSSPEEVGPEKTGGTPDGTDGKKKADDGKGEPADIAPTRRYDGHTGGITHLVARADGSEVYSSSLDRTVRIWHPDAPPVGSEQVVLDAEARERLARGKSAEERAAILEAPGATVATIAADGVLDRHGDWVKALGISGDERRLISGDDACQTIVWDLETRSEIARWKGYDRVWVTAAALSPDGTLAFTAEFAGSRSSFDRPAAQARFWDVADRSVALDLLKVWLPKFKDEDRGDTYGYAQAWGKLMGQGLVCAAFSPDGKLLAAGQGGETGTGQVHLVEVESGKILRTISGHQHGVCDVRFSADGKYVLSSGRDTTVRICQVDDGKEVAALGTGRGGQFKDWLHAIAISPDQQWVAAADIAGMVHVWNLSG